MFDHWSMLIQKYKLRSPQIVFLKSRWDGTSEAQKPATCGWTFQPPIESRNRGSWEIHDFHEQRCRKLCHCSSTTATAGAVRRAMVNNCFGLPIWIKNIQKQFYAIHPFFWPLFSGFSKFLKTDFRNLVRKKSPCWIRVGVDNSQLFLDQLHRAQNQIAECLPKGDHIWAAEPVKTRKPSKKTPTTWHES